MTAPLLAGLLEEEEEEDARIAAPPNAAEKDRGSAQQQQEDAPPPPKDRLVLEDLMHPLRFFLVKSGCQLNPAAVKKKIVETLHVEDFLSEKALLQIHASSKEYMQKKAMEQLGLSERGMAMCDALFEKHGKGSKRTGDEFTKKELHQVLEHIKNVRQKIKYEMIYEESSPHDQNPIKPALFKFEALCILVRITICRDKWHETSEKGGRPRSPLMSWMHGLFMLQLWCRLWRRREQIFKRPTEEELREGETDVKEWKYFRTTSSGRRMNVAPIWRRDKDFELPSTFPIYRHTEKDEETCIADWDPFRVFFALKQLMIARRTYGVYNSILTMHQSSTSYQTFLDFMCAIVDRMAVIACTEIPGNYYELNSTRMPFFYAGRGQFSDGDSLLQKQMEMDRLIETKMLPAAKELRNHRRKEALKLDALDEAAGMETKKNAQEEENNTKSYDLHLQMEQQDPQNIEYHTQKISQIEDYCERLSESLKDGEIAIEKLNKNIQKLKSKDTLNLAQKDLLEKFEAELRKEEMMQKEDRLQHQDLQSESNTHRDIIKILQDQQKISAKDEANVATDKLLKTAQKTARNAATAADIKSKANYKWFIWHMYLHDHVAAWVRPRAGGQKLQNNQTEEFMSLRKYIMDSMAQVLIGCDAPQTISQAESWITNRSVCFTERRIFQQEYSTGARITQEGVGLVMRSLKDLKLPDFKTTRVQKFLSPQFKYHNAMMDFMFHYHVKQNLRNINPDSTIFMWDLEEEFASLDATTIMHPVVAKVGMGEWVILLSNSWHDDKNTLNCIWCGESAIDCYTKWLLLMQEIRVQEKNKFWKLFDRNRKVYVDITDEALVNWFRDWKEGSKISS